MSTYQARITKNADGAFFAMIVYVHYDGEESVTNTYKSRHFATLSAAEKSTGKHLAKIRGQQ